jgi:hypothetical protein
MSWSHDDVFDLVSKHDQRHKKYWQETETLGFGSHS